MATFEALATKCAAGVALDLLVAIASVESGVHPLAVRDGAALMRVASVGEGVALVVGAADQGREARLGLMGLTERQLRTAGLTLAEGFDPCASLTAAASIVEASRAGARGPSADAADRVAIRPWWRSDGRFTSITAFEAAIARERTAAAVLAKRELVPAGPKAPTPSNPAETAEGASERSKQSTPAAEPDCWDVFARQRAGVAQCDDAPRAVTATPDPRVRSQPETASVVIFGSRATPR